MEDSPEPVPNLETQIQPQQQPMLQQEPPPTNEKEKVDSDHKHSGNGERIMTTDMDVRSWFEGLSSGEDRAVSMTVSDPAFIGMLMSMVVCDDDSSSSSTQVTAATQHGEEKKHSCALASFFHTLSLVLVLRAFVHVNKISVIWNGQ